MGISNLDHDHLPSERKNSLPPIMKWAGGKRWLVETLRVYWSEVNLNYDETRLVEPFCGGLSVALGLQPERALLNDVNAPLINLYKQVQQGFTVDIELKNDKTLYLHYREKFNEMIRRGEFNQITAQLFYYLNRTGFNGLCRFNKKGEYNVSFGRYERINYQADFLAYQEQLKHWQFTNTDFEEMVLQDTDFIYADPPYDETFTSYSKGGFYWEDQVRLAEWLAKHKGPVIASNKATDRIVSLYERLGFAVTIIDAKRSISCKASTRQKEQEMLAIKC